MMMSIINMAQNFIGSNNINTRLISYQSEIIIWKEDIVVAEEGISNKTAGECHAHLAEKSPYLRHSAGS